MNRVIKFRAWFHGAGDPRVDPEMKFSYPFPVIFWKAVEDWPFAVKVMQFTGLTTEDGTEIYENDIISDWGDKGIVKHGHYIFTYGTSDGEEDFNADMEAYGWYYEDENTKQHKLGNYLKVIGNIYENPNLFKYTLDD